MFLEVFYEVRYVNPKKNETCEEVIWYSYKYIYIYDRMMVATEKEYRKSKNIQW